MAETIDIKIIAAIENAEASKSVAELRKNLKELNSLAIQTQGVNSKAFDKIAVAIGNTQDKMEDLRDEFVAFKGSALEKFNATLQITKEGFSNLDFDKIGTSLKNLGKIILSNPLLLLATVIIQVVQNFDKLVAMGGFVGDMFKMIGDWVSGAIKLFTDFTDSIGLTNIATQKSIDLAKEEKKIQEDKFKVILEDRNKDIENYKLLLAKRNENLESIKSELDILQASGASKKDIFDKEQEYNRERIKNVDKELSDQFDLKQSREISSSAYKLILTDSLKLKKQINNEILLNEIKFNKEVSDENNEILLNEIKFNKEVSDENKKSWEDQAKKEQKSWEDQAKKEQEINDRNKKILLEDEKKYQVELEQLQEEDTKLVISKERLDKEASEKEFQAWKSNLNNEAGQAGLGLTAQFTNQQFALEQDRINNEIQLEEEKQNKIKEGIDNNLALRFDAIDKEVEKGIISQEYANESKQVLQNEANLQKETSDKKIAGQKRMAYEADKTAQISQATILGAIAVVKTFTQFGFPAGIIPAGLMAAQTILQVNAIKQQPVPQFAEGGLVIGSGTGTSDSINARLSNGESIINANSTSQFGNILSMINEAGGGRSFKGVENRNTTGSITNQISTQPIRAYVVESEISTSQRKSNRINRLTSY